MSYFTTVKICLKCFLTVTCFTNVYFTHFKRFARITVDYIWIACSKTRKTIQGLLRNWTGYRSNSSEVPAGLYSCSSSKAASSDFPFPFFLPGSMYSVALVSIFWSASWWSSSSSSWSRAIQL